ncbi:ATP-grasp domain-containing protein [Amphibacillus sp. Q70]|uniref:ATP-grasp domain-containing protein n=1 Tax=Amphibacillus sp. Q70 TaxID=3453416 RepID=UPI003F851783
MKYRGWLIYNAGMLTPKFIEIHEWYLKTAKEYQIDLISLSNSEVFIGVENGQFKLESKLTRPDFVLYLDKDTQLAKHLSELGIPVFNSPETIAICDDKNQMHQRLAKAKLPQPLTIFAPMLFSQKKEPDDQFLNYVEKSLSYPLIIKEAYGSFGQQVYLIENRKQLQDKAQELIHRPHLFQKYIRSSHGKDIRLHVVGDRVVASMKRVSKNDFRANVTNGGEMFAVDPHQEFIDLAIAASLAVGADFSGVDLLYDEDDQPLICEVNSNAHIKNIYQCTSIDVSAFIFRHILDKLKGYS